MDLYMELQEKLRQIDMSVKQLRVTGSAYAKAERDYNANKETINRIKLQLMLLEDQISQEWGAAK